jgi:N-acetylglucosaminyldiphosphoundecaprenol N-acetyl-beta-D-mannosaminyltransferase
VVSHINLLGYNIFTGEKGSLAPETGVLNTLNPHCFVIAKRDRLYHEALKSSIYLIPDGVGIVLASRFLEGKKIEKIAGSDLHEILIESLNNRRGSCFYLGSSDTTLKKIKARLTVEQPSIRVGSFSPPYKDEFSEEDNEAMIVAINDFHPNVLFVGMTAPKQEKWVYQNRGKLEVPLICSIGAVFDFYAGTVKRPGKFWISLGLEWLPRFFREPRRLWQRNLISTPLFVWVVLVEKVRLIFKQGSRGKSL